MTKILNVVKKNMVMSNIRNLPNSKNVFTILTVLVCMGYAALLSNKTMPYAEGWYTYYAQCINQGQVVYKDFDYLFPPVYIYFIALFTKIFGYKIIALRILGVIVFGCIGGLVYNILSEVFENKIAFISSISATFFLQSEVVQIFYDYVRVMDIFSCLSILFLVKFVKSDNQNKQYKYLVFAGVACSLFILIKQNMGIVFSAYAIILIIAVCIAKRNIIKEIFLKLLLYAGGLVTPMVVACTILICNGSLKYFFSQTGTQAIAAKGGVGEILFGWFFNNKVSFQNGSEFAASVLVILSLLYIIQLKNKHEQQQKNYVDIVIAAIFTLGVVGGIILCTKSEMFSRSFDGHNYLSPYSVFMIIVPLFFVFVAKTIYDFALKKQALEKRLCCIALTGAYISIAYGCGMSGGLAEGQATIGVGFIVAILLDNMKFKYSEVGKVAVVMICVLFTIQSAAKKMNYTYNWWGMDESSYWENTRESSDIDILKGIRLSEETLKSYETIYNIISEKTTKEDSIYCFPQIPIFYTICDRMDPGVRAKVEWFDVASDKSIIADMNVIEVNQPKAILIYETSEYAYACHENIFRAGEISATRKMKNFLLNYACKNGYTLYGRIESTDNNSFLLYYKEDGVQDGYTFIGDGTKEDPYLITSAQDLVQLSNQVANGNDFSKMYFRQTQDIDMGLCKEWKPIGEFDSGFYFNGVYDGNGFVIKSLHYDEGANIGLFGQLGGIVCNLGVVDCEFSGNCCGVIASHAVDENAMIINCYTNSKISGLRAGGIADNFVGQIINCVSYGECSGIESAGAVSYENGSISNVYGSIDNISSHIYNSYGNMAVKYCTEEYISGYLCDTLNNEVYKINTCVSSYNEMGEIYSGDIAYESWMSMATWCSWGKNKNGYAVLISK